MKLYNKGKAAITYGPKKSDVLHADKTADLDNTVAANLLRLYPHTVIDVANIGVEHLREQPPVQAPADDAEDAEQSVKGLFRGKKKAAE